MESRKFNFVNYLVVSRGDTFKCDSARIREKIVNWHFDQKAISIVSSNSMAARFVWATHLCCVWTSFEWNAVYVFAINSIASIRFFVLFSANRRRWAPGTNRNLHFVIFAECEISKDLIGIWRSSLNENQDGENFRHRLHTNCLRCCAPSASQAIINEWMNEWTRGDAEGSRRDESIWY